MTAAEPASTLLLPIGEASDLAETGLMTQLQPTQFARLGHLETTEYVVNYQKVAAVKVPWPPWRIFGWSWTPNLEWGLREPDRIMRSWVSRLLALRMAAEPIDDMKLGYAMALMDFLLAHCCRDQAEARLRKLPPGRNISPTACWSWP